MISKSREKPIKILHLNTRQNKPHFSSIEDDEYYTSGWSALIARYTKKFAQELDIEVWRPEFEISQFSFRIINGIKYCLFPAKHYPIVGVFSFSLIRKLQRMNKKFNIVVHHSKIHSIQLIIILMFFPEIAVLAQHCGDFSPLESLKLRNGRKYKNLILHQIEKIVLKRVRVFLVPRQREVNYLKRIVRQPFCLNMAVGVDFNVFRPLDKTDVRLRLGLPYDALILFYVGKLFELKGFDVLLDSFKTLKQKYDKLMLLNVGGRENDSLYKEAIDEGVVVIKTRIPTEMMVHYFNASDIYVVPAFNSGGYDVSTIEAFACNVPAVSSYLKDTNRDIALHLGYAPESSDDVTQLIDKLIQNKSEFDQVRQYAQTIFDWKPLVKTYKNLYHLAFENNMEFFSTNLSQEIIEAYQFKSLN